MVSHFQLEGGAPGESGLHLDHGVHEDEGVGAIRGVAVRGVELHSALRVELPGAVAKLQE